MKMAQESSEQKTEISAINLETLETGVQKRRQMCFWNSCCEKKLKKIG